MDTKSVSWAEVDEAGRLVLPPEVAATFGLSPGARSRIEIGDNKLQLHRPVSHLTKVYVEATNRCNISCRTCVRQNWDTKLGEMNAETFQRLLSSMSKFKSPPTIFFGGLGEPLFHKKIVEMVVQARAIGARVELITNGTLLDEEMAQKLIEADLDLLWVSIDGATPESYADVRMGAHLHTILANIAQFKRLRPPSHKPKPQIGIAFVAMKRNIADLPAVLALGRKLGARHFHVSNVLPHTEEMRQETLYDRTLNDITYLPSMWLPRLKLPRFEINETTREPLFQALNSGYNVTYSGNNFGGANDVCTFIEGGSTSIGWDGGVSPCPPLLHNHVFYLGRWRRQSRRHVIGNINEQELSDLWNDSDYVAYRDRVQRFAFAPCTFCGGCDLLDTNEEDCIGNGFPACGGCLWAQGVIQCP